MRRTLAHITGFLVIAMLAVGCGDDAAETTLSTAADPSTTSAASTTEGTIATTEATVATTEDLGLHPVYGIPWAAMAPPADGMAAEYELTNLGEVFRFPATYETGIEFDGGTWERLTIGEPGERYHTMYFDTPEPWVIRFKAWEIFFPNGYTITESMPEPLVFDLRGEGMSVSLEAESELITDDGEETMGMTLSIEVVEPITTITVPAGTFEVSHLAVTLGGELFGDMEHTVGVWMGAGMWFVRMSQGPAWENMELAEPWS